MSDEDLRKMVTEHDKHIDLIANSMANLAEALKDNNGKLDDVIDVISNQNLLMEKFSNLEINLKESFARVYARLETLELAHHGAGSQAVISVTARTKKLEESLTWLNRLLVGTVLLAVLSTVIVKVV